MSKNKISSFVLHDISNFSISWEEIKIEIGTFSLWLTGYFVSCQYYYTGIFTWRNPNIVTKWPKNENLIVFLRLSHILREIDFSTRLAKRIDRFCRKRKRMSIPMKQHHTIFENIIRRDSMTGSTIRLWAQRSRLQRKKCRNNSTSRHEASSMVKHSLFSILIQT